MLSFGETWILWILGYDRLLEDFNFAEEDRALLEDVTEEDLQDLRAEHIQSPAQASV